ncbi:MAG: hypothetical protein M1827_003718 [Pycnora praestabilis]|nr:MAG: hypothetical protein M1827_003718 [Pycnora praestabilis]
MAFPTPFQVFSSLRLDPLLLQSPANTTLSYQTSASPLYMLNYHRDRLLSAAQHFKWEMVITKLSGEAGLEFLSNSLLGQQLGEPSKIRILFSHDATITVETSPTPPVPLSALYPTELKHSNAFTPSARTGGAPCLGPNDHVIKNPEDQATSEPWRIFIDTQPTQPSPFTSFKTTSRNMYTEARARAGIKTYQEPAEVLLVNPQGEIMEGSLTSVYFFRMGRWKTPPASSGGQDGTTRRWLLEKGLCEEDVVFADSIVDGEECFISNGVRGVVWGRVHMVNSR